MNPRNLILLLAFTDLVSGQECKLLFTLEDGAGIASVRHPGCEEIADLSIELDAFYCRECKYNGRVSGAWCADVMKAAALLGGPPITTTG